MVPVYYPISGFVNFLLSLLIGIFIISKNKTNTTNRAFFGLSMSLSGWSFFYFLWLYIGNSYNVSFLFTLLMSFAIFISYFYLLLLSDLTKVETKTLFYRIIFWIHIFFLVTVLSGNFIASFEPRLFFPLWPIPTLIGRIYIYFFFAIMSYASYLVLVGLSKFKGVERQKMMIVMVGIVFGFLAGMVNYFLWLDIPIPPFTNILISGYVLMTGYAILKYRFLDIRFVIRRSLVFTVLVLIITALFSGSTVLFSTYISSFLGSKSVVMSGIITGVFVAVGFEPLKKLLTKMTDSILFKGQVDHAIALSEASQQIGSLLDLKKLSKVIEDTAYKVLKFSKLKIYIFNERTSQFSLVHKVGDGGEKDLTGENIVLQYYDDYDKTRGPKKLLVLDEVRYEYSQNKVEFLGKLIAYMEEHNLAVVAPLYIKEVALGFIFFGERKSGDPYSNEDLNFLRVLAGQAGVSFENAKLYDEQKQFTVKLQQEVDRATAELRSANKELKKLDQAKSEFISIASHQLRTPMTVIKGYTSMIESGDFGAVPEKMNKPVHSVSESASRLLALIEDLLNISRIESGRMAYEYEKANIKTMVESVYEELGQHAKKKGLEFVYIPPKFEVPDIIMDPKKIREVVMNLADNAIKYTDKGFVELHLEAKKDEITYFVKDSGRGLSKEDIGKLFKKFSRVGSAQLVHTEGTGLGLYIAKQIIKKHGGKIWAESQGAGKGSVFALSLKIKNPELDALLKEQQKTAIAQSGKKEQYMEDTIDIKKVTRK